MTEGKAVIEALEPINQHYCLCHVLLSSALEVALHKVGCSKMEEKRLLTYSVLLLHKHVEIKYFFQTAIAAPLQSLAASSTTRD